MQPKLLKSSQLSEFIPAEWHGVNESGYEPVSDFVLVLPDKAAAKSSGGVELPGDIVDRHTMAAETGILIAIGPESFKWISDRTRPWEGRKPQAGDRIYMKRYSGQVLMGDDGVEYRLMEDGCIGAVKKKLTFDTTKPLLQIVNNNFPEKRKLISVKDAIPEGWHAYSEADERVNA